MSTNFGIASNVKPKASLAVEMVLLSTHVSRTNFGITLNVKPKIA